MQCCLPHRAFVGTDAQTVENLTQTPAHTTQ
jgi:hypothetical protein